MFFYALFVICFVVCLIFWKRKPGRQRTLSLRYIQHLLGDTDNMIGPGKLSELAQDRCGWRKLVVTCSAADRWWWWWKCARWLVIARKGIWIPESGKFLLDLQSGMQQIFLVESRILGFGIRITAQRIRILLKIGIWNPSFTARESGIQYRNSESYTFLESLTWGDW